MGCISFQYISCSNNWSVLVSRIRTVLFIIYRTSAVWIPTLESSSVYLFLASSLLSNLVLCQQVFAISFIPQFWFFTELLAPLFRIKTNQKNNSTKTTSVLVTFAKFPVSANQLELQVKSFQNLFYN